MKKQIVCQTIFQSSPNAVKKNNYLPAGGVIRCAAETLTICTIALTCTPRPTVQSAIPAGGEKGTAVQSALLPMPDQGAVATAHYRNLFVEFGNDSAEVNAKISRAYSQLFHGDPENEAVFFSNGENAHGKLAYIMDVGNGDIRSEGMSYGMMIAVQMNQKADFDALWNWARSYMYHEDPNHPCYGYFSWQMRSNGTAVDEMPAPDGEEYFVTALFFAGHRWGDGQGIYNYSAEARRILGDLKNRALISGMVNGSRQTSCVALFHPGHKMIRFTPDTGNFQKNGDFTDPSYHLPAFYELWALWGDEKDRAFWRDAARVSRDFFVNTAHPATGLAPDYAQFDGQPKAVSWDDKTVNFRFDAWRVAMNWAVDAAWWKKDPREQQLSDRLLDFFASQGDQYKANYTLDGKPLVDYHSLGLVATNAVAALSATPSYAQKFVDALYRANPPTGKWRYYDGMLYLMSLLHVSGNFRAIMPL